MSGNTKLFLSAVRSEFLACRELLASDLGEARQLIYKHGYLRRKEELEEAEAALARFAAAANPKPEQR